MTSERWRRIEEIYHAALERAASERESFVEAACGGDKTLRADVERLIAAQDKAGDFLVAPAWEVGVSGLVAGTTTEDRTMSLVGRHIATYEILAPLGVGGMGEVYRARDTKLNREVAIKVLPEVFALDPDRLARFRREAHVLASLNHPNIAAIHGFEEGPAEAGHYVGALVLELVEGPTLADRIARGRMPLDEALPVARQIAEALEAAHERGIVHRDLKPANIKVRADGTVKVLDFGLAKVLEPGSIGADPSQSPTANNPAATQAGLIIGTAAYMAPEQARGRPADKRADMWAFGCVLYEMLSGVRAFSGEDVSETLAAVIGGEPDWHALTNETPVPIRRLLRRCLAKDPKGRLSDASMARLEIDEALSGPQLDIPAAQTTSRRKERFAWASALVLVAALAVAIAVWALRPTPVASEVRFEVTTPPTSDPVALAISPDGQRIVFVAASESRNMLWLYALDSGTATPLAGTDGAAAPFWSPDSRSVAFFSTIDSGLKRIDVDGRSLQVLGTFPLGTGGTWNRDGTILLSGLGGPGPIVRISSTGGDATPATRLESTEQIHQSPHFLPDGRHFLYHAPNVTRPAVYLGQLDGSETRRLVDADSAAVYLSSGYLFFLRQGTLFAQVFDPVRLELAGIDGGRSMKLTSNGLINLDPVWSPDDKRIVYASNPKGSFDLFVTSVDGAATEELVASPQNKAPSDWSPDGRFVLFETITAPKIGFDIWALALDGERKPFPVVATISNERQGQFSPDGQWLAYQSDETGSFEIYIQRFPSPGGKQRISTSGGAQVRWRRDGRELFYVALDGRLMSVPIQFRPDGQIDPGAPVPLFATQVGGAVTGVDRQQYVVSPDGQRFLMSTVPEYQSPSPITVILNWKP